MTTQNPTASALNTPEQIQAFGVLQLRTRLKLEIKGMTCRGKTAYQVIKDTFGFKGSKAKVLDQLETWLEQNPPYPGYVRKT